MLISGLIASFLAVIYELFTTRHWEVLIPYGVVNPLLFLVPRSLYIFFDSIKNKMTFNWVLKLEILGALVIIFNAAGSLFFHAHPPGFQYDRFLHFAMGVAATIIASLFFMLVIRKNSRHYGKKLPLILMSGPVIFVGLFAWELFQYSQDKIFDTRLFYDTIQPIVIDFWEDIFFGFIGILAGLVYISESFKKQIRLLKSQL